jgi:hypothetical protein
MDLATLSVDYGGFYAPSFRLLVGGRDLVRTELVAVSQVEADLVLGGAARFSFTVVDSYSLEQHAFITGLGRPLLDLLAFGTEVQVFMGYGDDSKAPVLMAGVITEISTDFPEAGTPELVIAGYDHAFPLTNGKSSRTWANTRDSDAVLEIAQFHNLGAQIDQTAEQHPQIEQNQESDFEFIKKLAERNHYEVYVDQHGTLRFAKPRDKDDGVVIRAGACSASSRKPTWPARSPPSRSMAGIRNARKRSSGAPRPARNPGTRRSAAAPANASGRSSGTAGSSRCCACASRCSPRPRRTAARRRC